MAQIGCVADDFTGAGDAASFLRSAGCRPVLYSEIPESDLTVDADAVVIALKSRTAPVRAAVEDSLKAFEWLRRNGMERLYLKYCSTFDSTKEGNIGPVVDAMLEALGQRFTILCPSLPVNGRTVKGGLLYVNGVPLHETHMKNHPLTPMWDADIAVLMAGQGKYPSVKVSAELLAQGKAAVLDYCRAQAGDAPHFYVIPDYYEDVHAEQIMEAFEELPFLTGGSGLLGAKAPELSRPVSEAPAPAAPAGNSILLAGSCSAATLEQIRVYQRSGGNSLRIDPMEVLSGRQTPESLWAQAKGWDNVLFYCSDTAENVKKTQLHGREKVAGMLEQTMAALARLAVKDGITQVIVAGGETSGAVTRGLGYFSYRIGESVAPGVPVMEPVENAALRMVLKSGNFGQPDFFRRAVEMTTRGSRGM